MTWLYVFLGAACSLDPAVQLFLLSFFPRRSNLISRHQHYPIRVPAGWDGAYHHPVPRERRCRGRARPTPGLRYGPLWPRAFSHPLVRPRSRISRYPDVRCTIRNVFSVESCLSRGEFRDWASDDQDSILGMREDPSFCEFIRPSCFRTRRSQCARQQWGRGCNFRNVTVVKYPQ